MKLASKRSARGCLAALIAFALICLPAYALAFGPVNAAHADLVAQTMHLPDVTDDMTDPAYWSNKQKDPDKVLIKRGTIDRLNLANVQADGTMLQPLKTAREYYYDAEKQIALKTSAEEEMTEFIGQAEDESGDDKLHISEEDIPGLYMGL